MIPKINKNTSLMIILLLNITLISQSILAADDKVHIMLLFGLARMTTWSDDNRFSSEQLNICFYGENMFGEQVNILKKGKINGEFLNIIIDIKIEDIQKSCHMLYINGEDFNEISTISINLDGAAVLLVSKDEGFTDKGGMIILQPDSRKNKMQIDLCTIKKLGMKINARLLLISKIIGGDC
jgi:hypothetical protein